MYQRGIRGAITIEKNTPEELKIGVTNLISEILNKNSIKSENISHVIFSLTKDINCEYPAKIAREEFSDWQYVPMMCVNEMDIENSLTKCLRILIIVNTELAQNQIKHIYLKGAEKLRKDLK